MEKLTLTIKSERIKAATVEKGLTSQDVAKLLDCHVVVYYGKLNGKRSWTLENLIKIKEITGKPFDYFFGID